jgi:ATP-dependent RNA helicase DeaD
VEVRQQDRFEALCRIIDMEPEFYGLVFCRTRVETSELAGRLVERGYGVECLHGEMDQREREQIMKRLRSRQVNILVATDVAARGIDIESLTHVINYDPPQDPDSYVHRIGRTGRAGRRGTAVTLVTPGEQRSLDLIRRTTGKPLRRGKLPGAQDVIRAKSLRIEEEIRAIMDESGPVPYGELAQRLLSNADPAAVVEACLRHACGDLLDPSLYRDIRTLARPDDKAQTRLFVARGKRQGLTAGKLLRFIREETGIQERLVRD